MLSILENYSTSSRWLLRCGFRSTLYVRCKTLCCRMNLSIFELHFRIQDLSYLFFHLLHRLIAIFQLMERRYLSKMTSMTMKGILSLIICLLVKRMFSLRSKTISAASSWQNREMSRLLKSIATRVSLVNLENAVNSLRREKNFGPSVVKFRRDFQKAYQIFQKRGIKTNF